MTSWQDLFFSAKYARLSTGELEAGKTALRAHMAAVRTVPRERLNEHMQRTTSPFDAAPGSVLTPAEREAGRASLRRFIAAHPPVPAGNMLGFLRLFSTPGFAVVAFFLCTGGAAYAAEGSMPGDALHPLKVAVNEPVLAQFYAGDAGKAAWALKVIERRAEEAAMLARHDPSDTRAWEALERLTQKAQDDAQTRLSKLPPAIAAVMRKDIAAHFPALPETDGNGEADRAKRNVFATLRHIADESSVATSDTPTNAQALETVRSLTTPAPALPPRAGGAVVGDDENAAAQTADSVLQGDVPEAMPAVETMMQMTVPEEETRMMFKAVPEEAPHTLMQMTAPVMHKRIAPPCSASGSSASGNCSKHSGSGSLRTSSDASSSTMSDPSPHAPSPTPEEVPPDALPVPEL